MNRSQSPNFAQGITTNAPVVCSLRLRTFKILRWFPMILWISNSFFNKSKCPPCLLNTSSGYSLLMTSLITNPTLNSVGFWIVELKDFSTEQIETALDYLDYSELIESSKKEPELVRTESEWGETKSASWWSLIGVILYFTSFPSSSFSSRDSLLVLVGWLKLVDFFRYFEGFCISPTIFWVESSGDTSEKRDTSYVLRTTEMILEESQ